MSDPQTPTQNETGTSPLIISNILQAENWFEVLQTTERTQTAVMVMTGGGKSSEKMNVHEKSDQAVLLVAGELHVNIGGEERVMKSGDTCIIPAGTPHRLMNRTETSALVFNVYSPPEYPPDKKR